VSEAVRAWLDVNVWIVVLDADHTFAERANAWFVREKSGFATCPIVENGVVRIIASPGDSTRLLQPIAGVGAMLCAACTKNDHEFWPDDVSLRDPLHIDVTRLHGLRQITEADLPALAVAHGGCFATFYGGVPLSAVPRARRRSICA
jgi:uncharacterized protein